MILSKDKRIELKGLDKVFNIFVVFLSLKSCKIKSDKIFSSKILKKYSFINLIFLLLLEENKATKQKEIILQFNDFIKVLRHLSISFFEVKLFKNKEIESLIKP